MISLVNRILHNFYQGYNLKYLSQVYERETTKTQYQTYLSIIVAAVELNSLRPSNFTTKSVLLKNFFTLFLFASIR